MHHLLPCYSVKILITHPALHALVLMPGFHNVLLSKVSHVLHCFLFVNFHKSRNRVISSSPSSLQPTMEVWGYSRCKTCKHILNRASLLSMELALRYFLLSVFPFISHCLLLSYKRCYMIILLVHFLNTNQWKPSEWPMCPRWLIKWDTDFASRVPHEILKST